MRQISFNRAELLVIIYQVIDPEGEICKNQNIKLSTKLT